MDWKVEHPFWVKLSGCRAIRKVGLSAELVSLWWHDSIALSVLDYKVCVVWSCQLERLTSKHWNRCRNMLQISTQWSCRMLPCNLPRSKQTVRQTLLVLVCISSSAPASSCERRKRLMLVGKVGSKNWPSWSSWCPAAGFNHGGGKMMGRDGR